MILMILAYVLIVVFLGIERCMRKTDDAKRVPWTDKKVLDYLLDWLSEWSKNLWHFIKRFTHDRIESI